MVEEGMESPLVTLRGQYVCGRVMGPNRSSPCKPIGDDDCVNIEMKCDGPTLVKMRSDELTLTEGPVSSVEDPTPRRRSARLDWTSPTQKLDACGLPTAPAALRNLTLANTKLNSTYRTIQIHVEPVELGIPRPASPDRTWSRKQGAPCLSTDDEVDEDDFSLRWQKEVVVLGEEHRRSPCFKEPSKPILKKPLTFTPVPIRVPSPQLVIVKKLVYADDPSPNDLYAVEDILAGCEMNPKPAKSGRKKGRKQKR